MDGITETSKLEGDIHLLVAWHDPGGTDTTDIDKLRARYTRVDVVSHDPSYNSLAMPSDER